MESQNAAERELCAVTERHLAEVTEFRRREAATRIEIAELQRQLMEAGERQAAVVAELRRATQQLSSMQMELDASRAIANAQRETVLVRDAEIARLEACIGHFQRTVQHQLVSSALATLADGRNIALPPFAAVTDLSAVSGIHSVESANNTSFLTMPTTFGWSERCAEGQRPTCPVTQAVDSRTVLSFNDAAPESQPRPNGKFVLGEERISPDSLEAMWRQLQLSSDSTSFVDQNLVSVKCPDDSTLTGVSDPRRTSSSGRVLDAHTRSNNPLKEKARIQERIKVLIGYREPAKKQTANAVGKPLVPGSYSDSNTRNRVSSTSTREQQKQAGSVADIANMSLLSTAVGHYDTSPVHGDNGAH